MSLYAVLTFILFRSFILSDDMLVGSDTILLGYFARTFYADFVRAAHELPFWNPYLQGGMPFVDGMHGDIFYPTTLLSFVMPVHRAIGWKLVLHVFLAGPFTYLWLRRLGTSRGAALWGGGAYLLAPALVSLVSPGADGKLFVGALTPLLFWATDRVVSGRGAGSHAALALVVALLIFTAHMQLAYFALWGAVGWALYRLFAWRGPVALLVALACFALLRGAMNGAAAVSVFALLALTATTMLARRRPALRPALVRFGLFAATGLGGVAVAAVQLLGPTCYLGGAPPVLCGPTSAQSTRVASTTEASYREGYSYSTSWSLHPEEVVALILPEFVGTSHHPPRPGHVDTYWGRNPFKLNHEYVGMLGLFLAPILFLHGRGTRSASRGPAAFFVALAAVALVFALGATTPLFHLFYLLVPGVRLFRAPSTIVFLFALSTTTLGALAIDLVRERAGDPEFARRVRAYCWTVMVALGALALVGSIGRVLPDLWIALVYRDFPPEHAQALAHNLANIKRGVWRTLLLAALTAGLVWGAMRGRLGAAAFGGGLLLLTVLDEWRVGSPFIRTAAPAALFPTDETIRYLQRERQGRTAPFRVFSAFAPDDNLPALHGLEQVQGHHGNEMRRYKSLTAGDRLMADDLRLPKLLNAEFVLSPGPLERPGLVPVARSSERYLYRLEGAFPRAYLVDRYEAIPDSVALVRLLDPTFDPARVALLEQVLPSEQAPQAGASGTVRWISHGVNRHFLEVEATAPAILIVTDNFYPGWQARIDGRPRVVRRADFTWRALPIPAGRHRVEFFYQSGIFRWSAGLSLAAGVLWLGVLAAPLLRRRRRPDV